MDEIAKNILKTSNQAIASSIDTALKSGIASRIVIFDKTNTSYSGASQTHFGGTTSFKKESRNYYFGTPSLAITDPAQCTIARGYSGDVSQYGRSVLVEANTAFDIGSTQGHVAILKKDTEILIALHHNQTYSCFDPGTATAKL